MSARPLALFALLSLPLFHAPAARADEVSAGTQRQLGNCATLGEAVRRFAGARDQGLAKMDAFQKVTQGQSAYVPGSLLDQTLQWPYDHPGEQQITTASHFYHRCVLDGLDVLTLATDQELTGASLSCQQQHAGDANAIDTCIAAATDAIVARTQTTAPAAVSATPSTATSPSLSPDGATLAAAEAVAANAPPLPAPVAEPPPALKLEPTSPDSSAPVWIELPSASAPAPVKPSTQVAVTAPAAPPPPAPFEPTVPAPVIAPAQTDLSAAAPVPVKASVPQGAVASPNVPVPAPAPVAPKPVPQLAAAAPAPVTPPAPAAPMPMPQVAAVAPAPAVVATPAASKPAHAEPTVAAGQPASVEEYGQLKLGMPLRDAIKTFHSYGERGTDEQGSETYTFLVGGGHAFITLRTSPTHPGELYGIQVTGSPEAELAPLAGVALGDTATALFTKVGEPTARTPVKDYHTMWSYLGRNYSFEVSDGGDVISLVIYGYSGTPHDESMDDGEDEDGDGAGF
ncbi:MAG TPA: hypothetical protein VHP13_00720 [Gammaproteobacteria bacterium]|jgi:hypothetical protein|nr:hypothetical protein [Gammaproteobacteria bacterium]